MNDILEDDVMNFEEARKHLSGVINCDKYFWSFTGGENVRHQMQMTLLEAVNKQIPMEPLKISTEIIGKIDCIAFEQVGICPYCGALINEHMDYVGCHRCLQAIKWVKE